MSEWKSARGGADDDDDDEVDLEDELDEDVVPPEESETSGRSAKSMSLSYSRSKQYTSRVAEYQVDLRDDVKSTASAAVRIVRGASSPRHLSVVDRRFQKLLDKAEEGSVEHQFAVGEMYEIGKGVSKDLQAALFWYDKAASSGHLGAMNNLGLLYLVDDPSAKLVSDMNGAMAVFAKAAFKGCAAAQYNLAVLDLRKISIEKSDPELDDADIPKKSLKWLDIEKEAFYWMRKAAGQKYTPALLNTGAMYFKAVGTGVPSDEKKATKWLKKVAEKRAATLEQRAMAMHNLIIIYKTRGIKGQAKMEYWLKRLSKIITEKLNQMFEGHEEEVVLLDQLFSMSSSILETV